MRSLALAVLVLGACRDGAERESTRARVHVTNEDASTVSVIDVATSRVTRTIEDVAIRPWGIAGTPYLGMNVRMRAGLGFVGGMSDLPGHTKKGGTLHAFALP
jgi:YVTN family beta-propeller protein